MDDLGLVLRTLIRQPTYSLAAVLSLAFGIGANTAIFSLLDQAVLRRLPVTDPDHLVLLYQTGPLEGSSSTDEPGGPSFSYPIFRGLRDHQTHFSGLAGARAMTATLSYAGE